MSKGLRFLAGLQDTEMQHVQEANRVPIAVVPDTDLDHLDALEFLDARRALPEAHSICVLAAQGLCPTIPGHLCVEGPALAQPEDFATEICSGQKACAEESEYFACSLAAVEIRKAQVHGISSGREAFDQTHGKIPPPKSFPALLDRH